MKQAMIISELNYMSSQSGEIHIRIPQVSTFIDVIIKICERFIYDLKSYVAPPILPQVSLVHSGSLGLVSAIWSISHIEMG